jgi:hypothetical protein
MGTLTKSNIRLGCKCRARGFSCLSSNDEEVTIQAHKGSTFYYFPCLRGKHYIRSLLNEQDNTYRDLDLIEESNPS